MKPFFASLKRTLTAGLGGLLLFPASVTLLSPSDSQARGVAVRGPRGGAAVRTPYGGAVRGPRGGAAVRRPAYYGGAASARGVARRTARRTTRRIYTLPRGYTTTVVGGVSYYYAGGIYYEPVYQGSTVVYVQVVFD